VAVVVQVPRQLMLEQARQVDVQQVVVVAEAAIKHLLDLYAVHRVLAAMDFCWSMKCTRYEQSLRDPRRHRPQHHRA
jgi:hypothetical protein